jgi:hypothetical protein
VADRGARARPNASDRIGLSLPSDLAARIDEWID